MQKDEDPVLLAWWTQIKHVLVNQFLKIQKFLKLKKNMLYLCLSC